MKILFATTAALLLSAAPAFAHMGDGGNSSSSSSSSSSQSAASNSNRNNNVEKHQAPGFGLGGLAATGECPIGSVQAAVSTPWGGLGFGTTKGDTVCRGVYLIKQGWAGPRTRATPLIQQFILNNDADIAKAYKTLYGGK